jgi:bacterioferritin
MASKKLIDLMNEGLSDELQVSIQYMWQHVLWQGVKGFAIKDELKKIAIEEMKHAEAIAERLNYLGGLPTTKPEPIFIGKTLKEMIAIDKKDEEAAIKLYEQIVELAAKEHDVVTKKLFEDILSDEEQHHDTFNSILEEV